MNPKPRLLFLSQVLPYPPDSGVAIRTFHTMRELSKHFDLTSLCFFRRAAQEGRGELERSRRAIEELGHAEVFEIPQEFSRARLAWDHVRSVLTGRPYTWYGYGSDAFARRLQALRDSSGFDLFHMDSLDLIRYAGFLDVDRTGCVHHNVESKLLRRRGATAANPLTSWYLKHQSSLLESAERQYLSQFAVNVAVSRDDEAELLEIAPAAETVVVPNGVDVDEFRPGGPGDSTIVFIGGTEWPPNVEALEFFGSQVLPEIRSSGNDSRVLWVGRSTEEEQARYGRRFGIELTGYVHDIRPWVADTSCVVVPLLVGGGTRLKITTAWAMGRAVVSTSVGCEGLEAADGVNILIRDDPAGFAQAVVSVLQDESLRSRLGGAARETAENRYRWETVMEPLVQSYSEIAG